MSMMTYDVAVFGTLRFGRGKFKTWQNSIVDSRPHRAIARTFSGCSNSAPMSVGELLIELPLLTGHGLFQIDDEGGVMHVRSLFTQSAFESRCRQLAALFLSSAEVGADGDVCFLGQGVFVGYGISVGGGKGLLMVLSEEEVQSASMDPELDVISGYFQVVTPSEAPAPESSPVSSTPISARLGATLSPPRPELLALDPKRTP